MINMILINLVYQRRKCYENISNKIGFSQYDVFKTRASSQYKDGLSMYGRETYLYNNSYTNLYAETGPWLSSRIQSGTQFTKDFSIAIQIQKYTYQIQ